MKDKKLVKKLWEKILENGENIYILGNLTDLECNLNFLLF
jgi:hypothetical protein